MAKIAEPPFDDPGADIILRSSDEVDFHVHKVILSMASPLLKDMISLPQSISIKETPVIPFEEDSTILDRMLRYCYPCCKPNIETHQGVELLANAASKYGLDGLVGRLEDRYMALGIPGQPLVNTFVLACRHKWLTVARSAAKLSLRRSMDELVGQAATIDFTTFSGSNYNKLLQYHLNCRIACKNVCEDNDLRWERILLSPYSLQHVCSKDNQMIKFWSQWLQKCSVEVMSCGYIGAMDALPEKSHIVSQLRSCDPCQRIPDPKDVSRLGYELQRRLSAIEDKLARTYISFD